MLNPIKSFAKEKNCQWCGNNCIDKQPGTMCVALAPPEGMKCVLKDNVCKSVEDNINDCSNLYWFDKTHRTCKTKEFCGRYTYEGLQTFETLALCNAAFNKIDGDANGDGKVDLVDFAIWKSEFLKKVNTKRADFNNDKKVDKDDFKIWKAIYIVN